MPITVTLRHIPRHGLPRTTPLMTAPFRAESCIPGPRHQQRRGTMAGSVDVSCTQTRPLITALWLERRRRRPCLSDQAAVSPSPLFPATYGVLWCWCPYLEVIHASRPVWGPGEQLLPGIDRTLQEHGWRDQGGYHLYHLRHDCRKTSAFSWPPPARAQVIARPTGVVASISSISFCQLQY